ncbi:WhiB family transcriptional regulator [Dietzia lutea]|nr:WhiB family transcriptional regulator [Dietzia lutea]
MTATKPARDGMKERAGALTAQEDRWAWADQGKCIGRADLFYNSDDESKVRRRRKEKQAKRLCETCPVKSRCQQHAMENRELYGVWGGLSENDRHRLAGRSRSG